MGPRNMEINIDKQLESPKDCIVFKLHTVECYRENTNHVSEERRKTLILSEQGEGTRHPKVVSAKTGVPSMHLATEWSEEGVKMRPVGQAPSPGVSAALSSWRAGRRGDCCSPVPTSRFYSASFARVLR